jgi:3-hydroxyacyl-CoA dehydrogenase
MHRPSIGRPWVVTLLIAAFGVLLAGGVASASAAASHRMHRGDCLAALMAGDRVITTLDELVAEGTINEEQLDAIIARLQTDTSRADRACAGIALLRSGVGGEAVRDLLGMDRREVVQAWRDGQSLAEMAEAAGVDRQTLIDTIIASFDERLSKAVEDGKITEERKAEIVANATGRIEQGVDLHIGELDDRPASPDATPTA